VQSKLELHGPVHTELSVPGLIQISCGGEQSLFVSHTMHSDSAVPSLIQTGAVPGQSLLFPHTRHTEVASAGLRHVGVDAGQSLSTPQMAHTASFDPGKTQMEEGQSEFCVQVVQNAVGVPGLAHAGFGGAQSVFAEHAGEQAARSVPGSVQTSGAVHSAFVLHTTQSALEVDGLEQTGAAGSRQSASELHITQRESVVPGFEQTGNPVDAQSVSSRHTMQAEVGR